MDRVNAAGGINGWMLKIISYDSQSIPAEAVAVTKRLIDEDKCVAIVGPFYSGAAIPMATIADNSHVPIIATTATNVNVTVDESGKVHPYCSGSASSTRTRARRWPTTATTSWASARRPS